MDRNNSKYYITTTTEGCATNLLENSTYRENLNSQGLNETIDPDKADVILVNTCAYTKDQEKRTSNIIEKINKTYPNKEVLVAGCYTAINPKGLKKVHAGKFFGPGDVKALNHSLGLKTEEESLIKNANFFDPRDYGDLTYNHKLILKLRPIFFKIENILKKKFTHMHNLLDSVIINEKYFGITVSQGCAGKCSFCVIKEAKGSVKSKPVNEIMHEFQTGLNQGYNKFWLLGDDIGCYGIDIGADVVELLEKMISVPVDFRLVINYFEPYFFIKYFDRLKKILSDERIINLNLPIQSGNHFVVRRMGREYDPKEVVKKLRELKKVAPHLVVKNNIIVGFPGERFTHFLDSIRASFYYDATLPIRFTSHPGTGAHKHKNHLQKRIKNLRFYLISTALLMRHSYVFIKSITMSLRTPSL